MIVEDSQSTVLEELADSKDSNPLQALKEADHEEVKTTARRVLGSEFSQMEWQRVDNIYTSFLNILDVLNEVEEDVAESHELEYGHDLRATQQKMKEMIQNITDLISGFQHPQVCRTRLNFL